MKNPCSTERQPDATAIRTGTSPLACTATDNPARGRHGGRQLRQVELRAVCLPPVRLFKPGYDFDVVGRLSVQLDTLR
jgi:hypothetical protein